MASKKVLIYGGRGGLGSVLVNHFRSKDWWVCSVDIKPNEEADENVIVDLAQDWCGQDTKVRAEVGAKLGGAKVDAILNMAGGWAGGGADSPDFVKNCDLMWKQSVWSSAISAALAAGHLRDGGLLVLPGARPALSGTPGMAGYGMAKAAVHQLVRSLGKPKSGMPSGATALALLPVTLDTPMNRKFMPDADTSSWTSLGYVAELLHGWATEEKPRPTSGSLVQMITKSGETELKCE